MPRLNRTRYLSCFYCGRNTSTPYDGTVHRFECPSCEATNYLDKNGQITDPPVATDKEATPVKFAVPRPFEPPSSPTNDIFCAECLKNQHLLNSALAQYLPDPDDPDYEEREKSFAKFRRRQEIIYPQICAHCEPRVREQLKKAAYDAKADALRRLLNKSTTIKQTVKQRGWLEFFDAVGRWLWIAGLVLQLCWHIATLDVLYQESLDVGLTGKQVPLAIWLLRTLLSVLPVVDQSLKLSMLSSILSAWWNPRFPQVFRGFTKHISGVSRWYFYQAVIIVMRVLLQRATALATPGPPLLNMQVAGHTFAAGFAIFVFALGPRSIRVNTAPLFQPHEIPEHLIAKNKHEVLAENPMEQALDEILNAPSKSQTPSIASDARFTPWAPTTRASSVTSTATVVPTSLRQRWDIRAGDEVPRASTEIPLNLLQLNNPAAAVGYDEDMDWAPTESKHRAFNPYNQRQTNGFNEAPTEPQKPFWYRVPPAPTTPAQRVFNPPNQPRLRKSPVASDPQNPLFSFKAAAASSVTRPGKQLVRAGGSEDEDEESVGSSQQRDVKFIEPRFFPPRSQDDPRDPLSDMFGQSFSLTEEERAERERERAGAGGASSWLSWGRR
ncbi:Ima1 N-terminal domain-containing protein [Lasiosphaeris hirsuta]|uniref:Ima1 N-terminal domain-containing protein n=1 Tax=Lasiosphaeris hirsuta TaxID=260670 RepID=A0AA39ZW78_9PEZI|nr:Ima1 N-terminal domain-containing protein [Lasiosphaeris hirsuta]